MFIRHSFGVDCVPPVALVRTAFIVSLYLCGLRLVQGPPAGDKGLSLTTWITTALFLVLSLLAVGYQSVRAKAVEESGTFVHSRSGGRSAAFWAKRMPPWFRPRDEWDTQRFFEPMLFVAIGGVLCLFKNWFGPYLLLCGYSLYHTATQMFKDEVVRERGLADSTAKKGQEQTIREKLGGQRPGAFQEDRG